MSGEDIAIAEVVAKVAGVVDIVQAEIFQVKLDEEDKVEVDQMTEEEDVVKTHTDVIGVDTVYQIHFNFRAKLLQGNCLSCVRVIYGELDFCILTVFISKELFQLGRVF